MEQVLHWDPEVIITLDERFYAHVLRSPLWRNVAAVRSGRVHLAPRLPFGWVDRPPSVNRLIGIHWLAAVLYPEQVRIDLRQRACEFYRLFYRMELNEKDLDRLLHGTRLAAAPSP